MHLLQPKGLWANVALGEDIRWVGPNRSHVAALRFNEQSAARVAQMATVTM